MMQENLLKEYGLYINGEWRPASDGATFSSTDPATGEHLAVCAEATKVDVDNAVKAAQKAFETWKDTTAQQRAEILNKIADIIVTEDISAQNIKYVFKNGQLIARDGKVNFERVSADSKDVTNTVNIKKMTAEDFKKDFDKNEPVIEKETGSLITNAVYEESSQGLSLCANIERYTGESSMGKCFLRGFTVENGAIAQTIGHDSHNISVIGSDGENMAVAVNALGKEGGIVVVKDKKVIANMPLPIGGLMSDLDYETVAKEQNEIVEGAKKICENGSSTLLMVLAFVSLLVIPHIKLNNRGLFNVDKFEFYKK
mgnify:CR=1 FL=1